MIDMDIPAPLPEHAVTQVMRNAEARMADGSNAQVVLVDAVLEYAADQKVFDLLPLVEGDMKLQTMILGIENGVVVKVLTDLAPEVLDKLDVSKLDIVVKDETTGVLDARETCMNVMFAALAKRHKPIGANRGKWLSKMGFAKSHTDALSPSTMTPPTDVDSPPPPTPEQLLVGHPDEPAEAAVLPPPGVLSPPPGVLPPPPPVLAPPPAVLPPPPVAQPPAPPFEHTVAPEGSVPAAPADVSGPVTPGVIRMAFLTFRDALSLKDDELAEMMGISRTTLSNMMTGKTAKPKCDFHQSRKMLADIDIRISKLRQAAEVFAAIKL